MWRTLVPFQIQQIWAAVLADHVREILGETPWIRLPSQRPQIPGVVAWQGRAIALFDLGATSGALRPLKPDERRRRTLVVRVNDATLAVPVDAVMEAEEVNQSTVRPCQVTRLENCSTEVELRGTPMPLLNLAEAMSGILATPA
jgi:chemotaxis signal transduction protein